MKIVGVLVWLACFVLLSMFLPWSRLLLAWMALLVTILLGIPYRSLPTSSSS